MANGKNTQEEAIAHGRVSLGKETCGYRPHSPRTNGRAKEVYKRMARIEPGIRGVIPHIGRM